MSFQRLVVAPGHKCDRTDFGNEIGQTLEMSNPKILI